MFSLKPNHFLILLLMFGNTLTAQKIYYNRFSAEITIGLHAPLAPIDNISRSNYMAFRQFEIAGRYMFSDKLGMKGHYAYNNFVDKNNTQNGIAFNRVGLEGVANIGKLLNVDYSIREKLGLLFHTGLGITYAKPSSDKEIHNMTNFLIGLTGEIKLSERFALLGDLTYVTSFDQRYAYNGEPLSKNTSETGSFINLSIGIMYNIGSKKFHADWY